MALWESSCQHLKIMRNQHSSHVTAFQSPDFCRSIHVPKIHGNIDGKFRHGVSARDCPSPPPPLHPLSILSLGTLSSQYLPISASLSLSPFSITRLPWETTRIFLAAWKLKRPVSHWGSERARETERGWGREKERERKKSGVRVWCGAQTCSPQVIVDPSRWESLRNVVLPGPQIHDVQAGTGECSRLGHNIRMLRKSKVGELSRYFEFTIVFPSLFGWARFCAVTTPYTIFFLIIPGTNSTHTVQRVVLRLRCENK